MSLVGLEFYPENDRDMYEIQYTLDFFRGILLAIFTCQQIWQTKKSERTCIN